MTFVVIVVAIAVPLVERVGFSRHRRSVPHHHVNAAVVVIVPIVILMIAVGVGFVVLRRMMRNPEGRFAAPIAAGLPRSERRVVGRDIRRGTPSDDPTLAAVERETAARTISRVRFAGAIFGVALVG
jgi:Trk-type K+ transport system membrane component